MLNSCASSILCRRTVAHPSGALSALQPPREIASILPQIVRNRMWEKNVTTAHQIRAASKAKMAASSIEVFREAALVARRRMFWTPFDTARDPVFVVEITISHCNARTRCCLLPQSGFQRLFRLDLWPTVWHSISVPKVDLYCATDFFGSQSKQKFWFPFKMASIKR
jgi:hypothetical protein